MMYVLQKERVEHTRLRALAQLQLNKEEGIKAFDEYMKTAFPWLESQKKKQDNDFVRILNEEVKKGGLAIQGPLWQENKLRSRIRSRVVERTQPTPAERARQAALYKKLGKVIPV